MPAGAGEDSPSRRRWRFTLTVVAWLFLVQSALGVITGPLAFVALTTFGVPGSADLSSYGALMGDAGVLVERLVGQLRSLVWVSISASVLMMAGSVGLLMRRRWGWFAVIGVQLVSVAATFVWGLPALEELLRFVAPAPAGATSLLMTVLLALVPLSVVGFLMLDGIVSQFRRAPTEAGD